MEPEQLTRAQVYSLLPPRLPQSHKGNHGHVLCVAGCPQFRGAAALCALGALRSGAGLVTLAAEECVITSVAARVLEAVFLPLPNSDALAAAAQKATVCALGCGCPETPDTAAQMQALLKASTGTVVLDAGGLCSLAGNASAFAPAAGRLVLTPHPGEMAKLAHVPLAQVLQMPADLATGLARQLQAVVVLKGHRTLIASPDGRMWRNTCGNAGLARGGSGDVLTGIIAGLAAEGLSPLHAALCGVWLHGAAADRCATDASMQAMLPEVIFPALGALFLQWEQQLRQTQAQ